MIKSVIEDEVQNEGGRLEDEAQTEIVNEVTEVRNDQEEDNDQAEDADAIRRDISETETSDFEFDQEQGQIVEQLKEEGKTTERTVLKKM